MAKDTRFLTQKPTSTRLAASRGGRSSVSQTGGRHGAGLIRGVSVVTRGEALGHRLWIDREALQQVAAAINSGSGVKSRFTHPSVSGDGLGTMLGHITNAKIVADRVIADLHFVQSAHSTPDGDLAGYVMRLADESPESFGASIVFRHDFDAEQELVDKHTDVSGEFRSPDPDNVDHHPHLRIASLRAVDAVDDPAANPKGLFSRGQEIGREADALLAYSLGLSTERPALSSLSVDAERVAQFVGRFLESHNLRIVGKAEPKPAQSPSKFADVNELQKPLSSAV